MVTTNLVNRIDDPVYSRVTANSCMLWVDKDYFKILVRRVLVDPVGVQDSEICAAAANALFGCRPERSLVLELVDTLIGGLA